MDQFQPPGVYVTDRAPFPPVITPVETAIPAFIGYTERINYQEQSYQNHPIRIQSLADYERFFGGACPIRIEPIQLDAQDELIAGLGDLNRLVRFRLFLSLQLYFANGGGPCYVVAVNTYWSAPDTYRPVDADELEAGLDALATVAEPTLLVLPDAVGLTDKGSYYTLLNRALRQCASHRNRFLLADIQTAGQTSLQAAVDTFRAHIGPNHLRYGAAYYPHLHTTFGFTYDENRTMLAGNGTFDGFTLRELKAGKDVAGTLLTNLPLYETIRSTIASQTIALPPGSAVAGVYTRVDRERGVWKAPANESLTAVRGLTERIDDRTQQWLTHPDSGKAINAIRYFVGKGYLIWGARTLAGNDNEWRYVSVRRFCSMVEASVQAGLQSFVFEPNDANTWLRVSALTENFLNTLWRRGALPGSTPKQAYYVGVGLNKTMTLVDILEGRLIVEIGLAVVRPSEFIILKLSQRMPSA